MAGTLPTAVSPRTAAETPRYACRNVSNNRDTARMPAKAGTPATVGTPATAGKQTTARTPPTAGALAAHVFSLKFTKIRKYCKKLVERDLKNTRSRPFIVE
jgi:hypothetical protein